MYAVEISASNQGATNKGLSVIYKQAVAPIGVKSADHERYAHAYIIVAEKEKFY